jgi:murein DD-endopeptidase MepM/ murein hydrolase activator NlpD
MRRVGAVLAVVLLLTGCSAGERPWVRPTPAASAASPEQTARSATVRASPSADPRWRFFTRDRRPRTSPWFAGAHPVMIGYGCTVAPYYSHDPRCPGRQGFHHGIDVAMPCGTRLFSAVHGTVVDPASAGAPGAAYGPYAFRIRTGAVDVLIGHVRQVYVDPGDAVRPGQLVARANDQGAPDGCHLHLEVRRAGTGLSGAVDPAPYLRLRLPG